MLESKVLGVKIIEPTPSIQIQNLLKELVKTTDEKSFIGVTIRSLYKICNFKEYGQAGYIGPPNDLWGDINLTSPLQQSRIDAFNARYSKNNFGEKAAAAKKGSPFDSVKNEIIEMLKAGKPVYLIAKALHKDSKKLKNYINNNKLSV